MNGRLVIIGLQGGVTGEVNLNTLLRQAGEHQRDHAACAAVCRRRRQIVAAARDAVWPLIEQGRFRVVVDRVLPIDRAAEAHRVVEESGHVGKVVLDVATVRGSSSLIEGRIHDGIERRHLRSHEHEPETPNADHDGDLAGRVIVVPARPPAAAGTTSPARTR